MPRNLIVYDFDESFTDAETDRWVFEVLSTRIRRLWETKRVEAGGYMPELTNECLVELCQDGFTKNQILEAIRALHFHPAMKRAVLELRARQPDTVFLCMSNSNTVYIPTLLEKHGLSDLFSAIICNPAAWGTANPNLLQIGWHRPPTAPAHGCTIGCAANLCKGYELAKWVESNGGWEAFGRVTFVGDGGNDLYPMLRLRQGDWAMVRRDMGLDRKLKAGREEELKAEVKRWKSAWEVDEYFQQM